VQANHNKQIATVSQKLTMEDIPWLHEQWIEEFKDLYREIPLRLLPLRLVNHEIRLIDPDKQYYYCLPKCADHYKEQLLKKIKQYTTAG
jgi:1-aminocyclopropane-1-carboxylate deaminase/D-cysteine desulfhydrase-like pyridoxal-dependent ACC family enzyme